MTDSVRLSDQQYGIMQVLWQEGEGSAKSVQQALDGPGLAHTTIATILSRLEKKGVLSSRTEGRERIYVPEISESAARRSMVSSLVSTLFKGDDRQLLAHLVKESDLKADDLEEIKELLAETRND